MVNHYGNLPFVPAKNKSDRMEVLQMSKEFNPVISFDVTSPESMIRTSVDP